MKNMDDLRIVAPVRERGLKFLICNDMYWRWRRSREGAWIEIPRWFVCVRPAAVAPVRERGLKSISDAEIRSHHQSLP